MSTDRRSIVLFDLFGVIARHQRPGALEKMAARVRVSADAFTSAYWAHRPPYDAGRHTASAYWTDVLRALSRPADADTIEELRLTDIDSWSRVDESMVGYVCSACGSGRGSRCCPTSPRTTRTPSSPPSPG
ncbi:hypothetical protein ACFY3E_22555 [Streptomyces griseorubiginosus]|uniref:hypothetical protein n=1 Tax=Streptomyces griseorubiginosus TaxID=67304 RepID=UPI003678355E